MLCAVIFALVPVSARAQTASLQSVLAARKSALAALNVHAAKTLEVIGALSGSALDGAYHSWQIDGKSRYEEHIGVRMETSLRLGDKQYVINQSGNVRELQGLLLARQRTEDFIGSDDFTAKPQYETFNGAKQLADGRSVYEIVVAPPDGQPETVDLDTKTLMIDRVSYDDEDGTSTEDYYDYKSFGGALVAQREVDSNGDHAYDMVRQAEKIFVDRPIAGAVFALPQTAVIQTEKPVTVPLVERQGHYYTTVRVGNRDYTFLVDTGAQSIVLDARVAQEQGLKEVGHLEVSGTARTGGLSIAKLDAIQIGGAALPVRTVTVLDLHGITGQFIADGVLGYPFFASAEVTIDPIAKTMTFAKPGALQVAGEPMPVDVDRELVEMRGKVNGTDGRFLIDTGNNTELLLFEPFMHAHPYLVQFGERHFSSDYGVGGAARAVSATVDELDLAGYRLYNRYASLMLTQRGAFADRFDAGNVGMGVLKNFVLTFDIANARMYVRRAANFDDGRYRAHLESLP